MKLVNWLKGNTLARNLVLGVAAVLVGAFVYSTQDSGTFQVNWALFASFVWVAIRGGAVVLAALIDRLKG